MAARAGTTAPPMSTAPDLPGRPAGLLKARTPGHGNPY